MTPPLPNDEQQLQPVTLADKASRVLTYLHNVLDTRERVNAPEGDARNVMLNNLAAAANGAGGTLLAFDFVGAQHEDVAKRVFRVGALDGVRYVAGDAVRAARLFLLLETQFQAENGLRNLLTAIEPQNRSNKFYQIAGRMIELAELQDGDSKKQVLMVPAHLRNSMHANGVHHGYRGQDTITTVAGVVYEFRHGQRVSCGGWGHVVHALTASLRVLEEIVMSPIVSQLAFVADAYAAQQAAEQADA